MKIRLRKIIADPEGQEKFLQILDFLSQSTNRRELNESIKVLQLNRKVNEIKTHEAATFGE